MTNIPALSITRLWSQLLEIIEQNYEQFEGFVILHPIQYLEYSSAAISFALQNLSKPVIFTGYLPSKNIVTDRSFYIKNSMEFAAHYRIPEVLVFASNLLFRANRISKKNFQKIFSPNEKEIGFLRYGELIVDWERVQPMPKDGSKLIVRSKFESRIGHLLYNPFISNTEIDIVLSHKATKAIVIETYGIGDLPDNNEYFFEKLKEAQERGVLFYAVTQCGTGFVSTVYVNNFTSMGILSGFDLLTSSCVVKLSFLLGQFPQEQERVKNLMNQNMRGEVTASLLPGFKESGYEDNIIEEMLFEDSKLSGAERQAFFSEMVNPALLAKVLCQPRLEFFRYMLRTGLFCREKLFCFRDSKGNSVLHFFAQNGNEQIWTPLSKALNRAEFETLSKTRNKTGLFPLLVAIKNGNRFAVKVLKDMLNLEQKREMISGNSKSIFNSILLEPCKKMRSKIQNKKIQSEGPKTQNTGNGGNQLKWSDIVSLAIFADFIKLNEVITLTESNLLHLCVLNDEKELCELLIENKAVDFKAKNKLGQSALDLAKLLKKSQFVKIFEDL